jgi:hypothetical protein
MEMVLEKMVAAFNQRDFTAAAAHAETGCATAHGADETFWLGLYETCLGYALIMDSKLTPAEKKLVSALEKLRDFGFRHQNLEVTGVLAGVRQAIEEIRAVREGHKRIFDVTLLPQLRLAARAEGGPGDFS